MMKNLLRVLLVFALAALPAVAQSTTQSTGDAAQSSAQSAGTDTTNAAKDAASATQSGTTAATDKMTGKVDINSADKEALMQASGLDEATVDKIIAGRPYKSKHDLLTRDIVDQSTYDKINAKIVAHQAKQKPNAAANPQ